MAERTVLITGASRGIGHATALHLATQGFRVYGGVRRQEDADRLRAASRHIIPVTLDVTDATTIEATIETITASTDRLDGLVNNAGLPVAGPLEALPMDQIRLQFDVNVFGVIAVTRACIPLLRTARGRIVNVSSINGRIVTPFNAPYGASKFALEALSDGWRLELEPWGIEVVVIQPGAVATPIWESALTRATTNTERFSDQHRQQYRGVVDAFERRDRKPPPRAIPPERVASVIARALTVRRPRTRYLVGRDARLGAALKYLLPDRWIDALLTRRWRRR